MHRSLASQAWELEAWSLAYETGSLSARYNDNEKYTGFDEVKWSLRHDTSYIPNQLLYNQSTRNQNLPVWGGRFNP